MDQNVQTKIITYSSNSVVFFFFLPEKVAVSDRDRLVKLAGLVRSMLMIPESRAEINADLSVTAKQLFHPKYPETISNTKHHKNLSIC